jgi:hypothetical protein
VLPSQLLLVKVLRGPVELGQVTPRGRAGQRQPSPRVPLRLVVALQLKLRPAQVREHVEIERQLFVGHAIDQRRDPRAVLQGLPHRSLGRLGQRQNRQRRHGQATVLALLLHLKRSRCPIPNPLEISRIKGAGRQLNHQPGSDRRSRLRHLRQRLEESPLGFVTAAQQQLDLRARRDHPHRR